MATFARFGIEAGKGEQKVRQEAEAEANARQQAALSAQATANALRAETDITKTILNAQSRQDAEAFESFMRGESAKREIAWRREKTELGNMHDFEREEQRKDIENQLAISANMRQKSKRDSQIQSLRDAHERGQLSEKQMNDEILRVDLGIPSSRSTLFRKGDESNVFTSYLDERDKKEIPKATPEQKNATALLEISTRKSTSAEDKIDIDNALKSGDAPRIKITLDIMEAKQNTGILGRASGVFFGKSSPRGGNKPYRPTLFSPALSSF